MREYLKQARVDKGLSHDRLAEKSGLARNTVMSLLSGKRETGLKSWWKLARALDVDFSVLVRLLDS